MRNAPALAAFAGLVAGLVSACSAEPEPGTAGVATGVAAGTVDPAFRALVEAAAREYERFGRVDDLGRWAPEMCMAPPPPAARFSEIADETAHGGKLYSMYALDRDAYVGLLGLPVTRRRAPSPTAVAGLEDCTQVIVKETFAPVAREPDAADAPASGRAGRYARDARGLQPAQKGGVFYVSGERRGLFVMLRLDPATPDTDDGWVYATVAVDGSVTSCGRVASCMECHLKAPHGRLFGLPDDWR